MGGEFKVLASTHTDCKEEVMEFQITSIPRGKLSHLLLDGEDSKLLTPL